VKRDGWVFAGMRVPELEIGRWKRRCYMGEEIFCVGKLFTNHKACTSESLILDIFVLFWGEKGAIVNDSVAGQGTAFVLHLVDIQLRPELAVNFESIRRPERECITTTCGSSGKYIQKEIRRVTPHLVDQPRRTARAKW
jgi:hypothetical protein